MVRKNKYILPIENNRINKTTYFKKKHVSPFNPIIIKYINL